MTGTKEVPDYQEPAMKLFDASQLATSAREPVALEEMSFEQKVAAAVCAVKQELMAGKHLVVAWSGGKLVPAP